MVKSKKNLEKSQNVETGSQKFEIKSQNYEKKVCISSFTDHNFEKKKSLNLEINKKNVREKVKIVWSVIEFLTKKVKKCKLNR